MKGCSKTWKDVLKQEKEVLKQENNILKQENIQKYRVGHASNWDFVNQSLQLYEYNYFNLEFCSVYVKCMQHFPLWFCDFAIQIMNNSVSLC